jgi:hypothetical protein
MCWPEQLISEQEDLELLEQADQAELLDMILTLQQKQQRNIS